MYSATVERQRRYDEKLRSREVVLPEGGLLLVFASATHHVLDTVTLGSDMFETGDAKFD